MICLMFAPMIGLAAQYSVSGTWSDPTPASAQYTPAYDAEYRINGGAVSTINDLSGTAFAISLTLNGGDLFEARVRARNTQGGLVGAWGQWYSANVPMLPTAPADQGPVTIQFTVIVP